MAQNNLKLDFFKKCIYTLAAMWVRLDQRKKMLLLPSAKIGCISGMRIKNVFYSSFHSICTIFATERAKKQIEAL